MSRLMRLAGTALLGLVMRILIISVAMILLSSAGAMAQVNTPAQRQACEGDVLRLCFWNIPNRAKIIRCMSAKHDQLSPRCMAVFDAGMRKLGR